jgi:uncharacterized membrane protein YgcG
MLGAFMTPSTAVRYVVLTVLALLGLFVAGGVVARAQESWVVRSFDAAYRILEDGNVEVTEDIVVDFGSLERHGIFRDIPVEYEYEPDPDYRRVIDIDVVSITDGSRPVPYETSRAGGNLQIKVGDPDVEVTGEQRYVITYVAEKALNPQEAWDEFYWNVTGNDWEVTVESASAVVDAPSIERTTCFEGPTGSTDPCGVTGFPRPVFGSTRPLPPGSGLTIVVGLTKGSVGVPALNLVKQKSAAEKVKDFIGLSPLPIAAATFLGIVGTLGVVRYWWLSGRDKWYGDVHYLTGNAEATTRPLFAKDSVVVEYMPPELVRRGRRLRPAEIGALLDERADTLDVTATLVDLAVRGYLRITEIEKTWIFGSKDYRLEKLKEPDEALLPYEASLLRYLFDEGDSVEMSGLKNTFYTDLAKVKEALYTQVVNEDKFFPKDPEKVRNYHRFAGIAIILAGAAAVYFLGSGLGAAIVGVPIILVGLLVLVTAGLMPRRTPAGREMYRRVLGFREYIEVAETDRQRFFEEENIFQEYLPYAIVFGSVDKWAKAFEEMGIEPNTSNWYVGTTPFRAVAFSHSLQGFSSSMSSAIASTPGGSGSSGFSGGSSGGGGGGGGGGSW